MRAFDHWQKWPSSHSSPLGRGRVRVDAGNINATLLPEPFEGRVFDDAFVEGHGYEVAADVAAGAGGAAAAAAGAGAGASGWEGFGKQPSTTEQNAANFPASIFSSE